MWITAPFGKDTKTESIFLNRKDFEMAQQKVDSRDGKGTSKIRFDDEF